MTKFSQPEAFTAFTFPVRFTRIGSFAFAVSQSMIFESEVSPARVVTEQSSTMPAWAPADL